MQAHIQQCFSRHRLNALLALEPLPTHSKALDAIEASRAAAAAKSPDDDNAQQ